MKLKKARNGSIPVPEMTITHDGFGFIGWSYDKLSTNPEYIVGNFFKDDNQDYHSNDS